MELSAKNAYHIDLGALIIAIITYIKLKDV